MMQRLLCTVGFTGKTAEEFFALLSGAGVQQVIDVRQNRSGQLSGFSKHPDLSFFSPLPPPPPPPPPPRPLPVRRRLLHPPARRLSGRGIPSPNPPLLSFR